MLFILTLSYVFAKNKILKILHLVHFDARKSINEGERTFSFYPFFLFHDLYAIHENMSLIVLFKQYVFHYWIRIGWSSFPCYWLPCRWSWYAEKRAPRLERDPACWAERRPSLLYWSTCLRVIFGRVFQRSTLRSFTTRSPRSRFSPFDSHSWIFISCFHNHRS